ncbi:cation transporter, partial [Aerococcus urinae]|nr:cation transporter [Aerococcus urinae]
TLRADGKHLLTDVITSVGVIVGVGLVALTDEPLLDPIVAILVAANILLTGVKLLRESLAGLMDAALPDPDTEKIVAILRS